MVPPELSTPTCPSLLFNTKGMAYFIPEFLSASANGFTVSCMEEEITFPASMVMVDDESEKTVSGRALYSV